MTASLAHRVLEGLAGADYNRFPTSRAIAPHFKQWVHVAVIDPDIALVANFSALPAPGETAHRLTVLVRDAAAPAALRGHVRRFAPGDCAMHAGHRALRFGASALIADGDAHRLVLEEPALALRARLTLRAVAAPSVLRHLPLGARAFHWAVVPRLVATGAIELAGRRHDVVAPAYRDRNWGAFQFGDVAWDWGYLAAPVDGPPCAIAFARLLDAARTRVVAQHVLVWWGDRLLASFRDREIELASEGACTAPIATIPPALALCRPGRATGVPEAIAITCRSSRGELAIHLARAATARIIVPNDARLGTTAIHESFAAARATGRVEGQAIALAGHGFLEGVRA